MYVETKSFMEKKKKNIKNLPENTTKEKNIRGQKGMKYSSRGKKGLEYSFFSFLPVAHFHILINTD